MRYSDDPSTLGHKLGPKLADIVARSIIASHVGLTRHKHDVGMAVFHSASDQISEEVHATMGPALGLLLQEDLQPEVRELIEQIHHKKGQLTALAGQSIVGATLGSAIGPLINSLLYPTTSRVLAGGLAQLPPDTGTVATLVAKGITPSDTGRGDMQGQGLRGGYSDWMIEAARAYPDIGSLLEMLRRKTISRAEAELSLTRAAIPRQYHAALLELQEQIVSPPDAALAVLRGTITEAEGIAIASKWGVSSADFNLLILNTGEPPGLEQMLEAYRRGFINRATLERGIRQSRVRDEWIGMVEQLRYQPMSTADAVQAAVQNHLDKNAAKAITQQNGLEPAHFETLYENAGEPLAHGQLATLYNRGQITRAVFDQGIRESRLKDKYLQAAFELRLRVPAERYVITMLKDGVISHEQALTYLRNDGYDAQTAAHLVASGVAQKTTSTKELSVSTITGLYEDRAISKTVALGLLKKLKYDQQEAEWILELANLKAMQRVQQQAVAAVRSRYVSRHINEGAASVLLDGIGIASAQRDLYLRMWGFERQANVRVLSEAQVAKAVKLGLISPENGVHRLTDMGYSESDADLLIKGA